LRAEQRLHLQAELVGGEQLIDSNVLPGQRLIFRDRPDDLDVVSEAERRTGQSASSRIRCAELPSRNLPTRLRWRSPMTMSVASASCVTLRRCSLGSK
jgi:hypothetical protein